MIFQVRNPDVGKLEIAVRRIYDSTNFMLWAMPKFVAVYRTPKNEKLPPAWWLIVIKMHSSNDSKVSFIGHKLELASTCEDRQLRIVQTALEVDLAVHVV